MKKILAFVMIASILGAFMAGCSKSDDSTKPADTTKTDTAAPTK